MVTGELRVGCAELDATNYAICNYTYFKHSMLSPLQQPQSFKNPVSIFSTEKKTHVFLFTAGDAPTPWQAQPWQALCCHTGVGHCDLLGPLKVGVRNCNVDRSPAAGGKTGKLGEARHSGNSSIGMVGENAERGANCVFLGGGKKQEICEIPKKLKTGGGLQAYMHGIEKHDKILSSMRSVEHIVYHGVWTHVFFHARQVHSIPHV